MPPLPVHIVELEPGEPITDNTLFWFAARKDFVPQKNLPPSETGENYDPDLHGSGRFRRRDTFTWRNVTYWVPRGLRQLHIGEIVGVTGCRFALNTHRYYHNTLDYPSVGSPYDPERMVREFVRIDGRAMTHEEIAAIPVEPVAPTIQIETQTEKKDAPQTVFTHAGKTYLIPRGHRELRRGELIPAESWYVNTARTEIYFNQTNLSRHIGKPYDPAVHLRHFVRTDGKPIELDEALKLIVVEVTAESAEETTQGDTMQKLFELKAFVNGTELKDLNENQILSIIATREAEIKQYSAIENKPARIKKLIDTKKTELAELVAFLDAQDAPAPAPAQNDK